MPHSRRTAFSWRARLPAAAASAAVWITRTVLTAGILGIAACSDTLRTAGPTPAAANLHADELFAAFAARFTDIDRTPHDELSRTRLASAALTPSRIFDDTALWSLRPSPVLRILYTSGDLVGPHYHLETRTTLTAPAQPGDTRHSVILERIGPSTYQWNTNVDFAVGSITADEASQLIASLFSAAAAHDDAALRNDYRTAFPHAAAAFGRGFSVDSIHAAPGGAGTTSVSLTLGFHPELMRPAFPALAGYLDKYLGPAKYHLAFTDKAGVALLDVDGRDRALTVRYRVLDDGGLVSLFGPPRAWPDSLQLAADLSLKIKLFTVGFRNLHTEFVIANGGHDRSWTIVARQEPDWKLPLVTERLLRTPLRHPFEGAGALFRLSVHDSAGMQTILGRRTRLDVQESPIVRFLGSLGAHAMGDINPAVERDEDRFLQEGFAALRADTRVIFAGRENR